MKDIKDFLEGKFGKPKKVNDLKQKAKGNVLNEFKDAAKEKMAESMNDSMKKVTVVAKDKKDLKKGLDEAERVIDTMPETEDPQEAADDLLDADDDAAMGAESHDDEEDKDSRIADLEREIKEMREAVARAKK